MKRVNWHIPEAAGFNVWPNVSSTRDELRYQVSGLSQVQGRCSEGGTCRACELCGTVSRIVAGQHDSRTRCSLVSSTLTLTKRAAQPQVTSIAPSDSWAACTVLPPTAIRDSVTE